MKRKHVWIFLLVFAAIIVLTNQFSPRNIIVQAEEGLSEQARSGKELFDEVNCLLCHLLDGEGGGLNDAPDLKGVSTRKTGDEIPKWLKTHLFEEPRLSMFEDEPPTDEDIADLTAYLVTL
ncbi:MAG: c-type cytochrome [bacterium]